jgi:DNA repair ATPase RecN
MVRGQKGAGCRLPIFAILALASGCTMVPRAQVAECQRTAQTLRAENARFKDQLLAYQAQNRDYADRAVDDSRRLATQEEKIAQLEESNRAYRNDRDQVEAAFQKMKANLGDLGASTVDARAWPSAGSQSASTRNKSASGSTSASKSSSDDYTRVR